MLIELKCKGPVADKSLAYLTETHSLIAGFVKIHSMLSGRLEDYYDEEYKEMGVSLEECILYNLDEVISNINFSSLPGIICRGYFGEGLSNSKYLNAYTKLEDTFNSIRGRIDCMTPYSCSELVELATNISYALGDMLFAFSEILYNPVNASYILTEDETFTYSQDIQQFFSSVKMTPEQYAAYIVSLRSTYISVIPLFVDRPDEWITLTKDLHPSMVDMLIDYGTYITEFDVRAAQLGLLKIDENFIDELQERSESSEYIGVRASDAWLHFTKLLTDEQVRKIFPIVSCLNPEDLTGPIEEGSVNDKFIDELSLRVKGGITDATNYF